MTFDPNVPDPDEPRTVTLSRKDIKRLEESAKKGKEAQAELEQLKKERAFVMAGVPVDDKRFQYFAAGYQGEQTPEAIKAEWQSTFGTETTSTTNPAINTEITNLQSAADLGAGGLTIPPDRLAERDAKLSALSPTDPHYDQKFAEIFESYGGVRGGLVG